MCKSFKKLLAWMMPLTACICAVLLFAPAVYADTDGTELKVTDQPEKLVIQLGTAWAGVEFELKTDTGLYPQPVVVSAEGVLSMELGGSKTYTLSAMNSPNAVPDPDTAASGQSQEETSPSSDDSQQESSTSDDPDETDNPGQTDSPEQTDNSDDSSQSGDEQEDNNLIKGIPNMHLFLFTGGLVACIAGLVVMQVMKRRKNNQYDDSDDYGNDDNDD